jgi:tape measure domain-containing protein
LAGIAASLAAGFSIDKFQELIDASVRVENALKVSGLQGEQLKEVFNALFASAQKNAAPLESLATLYGRVATVQKELGVSTEDVLKFTDNVALALRVAGTDATTASSALLQLSQALGSGTVHAEEFNSLLEGALPIVQAAAEGITDAGGSVSKLRQLVNEGKVSSEAFFRGFEAGAASLQVRAANPAETVSQAMTKLNNALLVSSGRLNDLTGASQKAAGYIRGFGDYVDALTGSATWWSA